MNRIDLDNYNQLLSPAMEFERISPYMLFKDGDDIRCLWFFNKADCDKFSELLISFGLLVEAQPDALVEPPRPGAYYPKNTTGIITPPMTAGSKIFNLLARNVEASQARKSGGQMPAFATEQPNPAIEPKPVNGAQANEPKAAAAASTSGQANEKNLLSLFKDSKVVYTATEKPPRPMREQDFLKNYGYGKNVDRSYAKKTQKLFNRTNGSGNQILQPTPVKKQAAPWANLFAQPPVQPKQRATHGVLPFNRTPLLDHNNPLERPESLLLEHPKSIGVNRNYPNKKYKGPEQGGGGQFQTNRNGFSPNQYQNQNPGQGGGGQFQTNRNGFSPNQYQNQNTKVWTKPKPLLGNNKAPSASATPSASTSQSQSQPQLMSLFPSSSGSGIPSAKQNYNFKGANNGANRSQNQGNNQKKGGKKTKRQWGEDESKNQQQPPPSDCHFLPIQRESTKVQEKEKEKENNNNSSKDLQKLLMQMQIFDKSTKPEQSPSAGAGVAQNQASGDSTIFGPISKSYN
jgi:hypothetical protein